jgi:transcription initiation factor TFIIIB Brf1 subunit/transcription initiation factor TFIIB
MPQIIDTSTCKHMHMQLISKDEETEYWECLDCGEIIEPCETVSSQTRFQESLSDA